MPTVPLRETPMAIWLPIYVAIGLALAAPATFFAIRRGVWPGILAGIATYIGLGLLGFGAFWILVAIFGGGVFGVGFGEAVLLSWMAIFLLPSLLLGLLLAAFVRWRSRNRKAETTP